MDGLKAYIASIRQGEASGIVGVYNKDIFSAVYATNLLMPVCDLMLTKPSELAYYPIPKVFMRHIGGHEVYGAINGREKGDSTFECPTAESINEMFDRLLEDKDILAHMCDRIDELHRTGYYDGAYECVRLAAGLKK